MTSEAGKKARVRAIISDSILEFTVERLARGERVARSAISPLEAYRAGFAAGGDSAPLPPEVMEAVRELERSVREGKPQATLDARQRVIAAVLDATKDDLGHCESCEQDKPLAEMGRTVDDVLLCDECARQIAADEHVRRTEE